MEEFELPVLYKGKELMFPTTLQLVGYTYRLVVDVNGQKIHFEPDEERNYRAVLNYEDAHKAINIDQGLVTAILESIEKITK